MQERQHVRGNLNRKVEKFMMKNRKFVKGIAVAAIAAMSMGMLAGCGGGGDEGHRPRPSLPWGQEDEIFSERQVIRVKIAIIFYSG